MQTFNHHATLLSAESWEKELRTSSQSKHLSAEDFISFAGRCFLFQLDNKAEVLSLCRMILTLFELRPRNFLQQHVREVLFPFYEALFSEDVDQNDTFIIAYKALISHLLGYHFFNYKHPKEKHNFTLKESLGVNASEHLPSLQHGPERSLVFFMLGLITQDAHLIQIFLESSFAHLKLFDEMGNMPKSLWISEKEYDAHELLISHKILFQVARSYSGSSAFASLVEKLESKIQQELDGSSSIFYMTLEKLIRSLCKKNPTLPSVNLDEICKPTIKKLSLGMGQYKYQDLCLNCCVSGAGTSFASLSLGSVEVVGIGPHYYPLGIMENFGIYRTPVLKELCFREVSIKQDQAFFAFDGYTRTVKPGYTPAKPGNSWLRLQCKAEKNQVDLEIFRIDLHEESSFDIAFFIKAQKATVDGMYALSPSSLNRYEGKIGEVSFTDNSNSIKISIKGSSTMQLIPLAGESHFWGATFLLAVPAPKESPLQISFR